MTKSIIKIQAQRLRRGGYSLKDIAIKLSVSKSTVSGWCRGIKLTEKQSNLLFLKKIKGLKQGRIKGVLTQKQKRLEKIENYKIEGEKKFEEISNKEFFVAGLTGYLVGGSKKNVSFSASDPVIVNFMLKWLEDFFKIPPDRFKFLILFKYASKNKVKTSKRFWSKYLKFPTHQFKIIYSSKSKQKKSTKKLSERLNGQYGTLTIQVSKSTDLFYKILGLTYGFFKNFKKNF